MRGSGWGIFHHWAVGKLNSTGSWCTMLSYYMGGWCPRKLNSMGGWVKKKGAVFHPLVFFSGIADFIGLPYFSGFQSGLKSHVLISHDFLSLLKFVPLPRDQQPCARGQHQNTKRNSVL